MSEKRLDARFLLIPNDKDLKKFINYDFYGFILPLKDFSIGFDNYFDVDEINNLSKNHKIFVILNRFLHKKDLESIKTIIKDIKNVEGFFIEDLGLINILGKDNIIINQNHIINNYDSVTFLKSLNLNQTVVSNELTIDELMEIRNINYDSVLYYNLICRNSLMYSKRELLTNYFQYYGLLKNKDSYQITEKVSNKGLIIKEENGSTIIFDKNIFVANKYLNKLNCYDFLIVNINNMNFKEVELILNNYQKSVINGIESNYYFLENKIGYKVGNNA